MSRSIGTAVTARHTLVDLSGSVRTRHGGGGVLVEHEEHGGGGTDGGRDGGTDLRARAEPPAQRGPSRTRPALGLVGGHPVTAAGVAAALGTAVEVVTAAELPAGSTVLADLTCAGCSPTSSELAALAQRHAVVLLVGSGQVGLAEEALADGASGAAGGWESLAQLRQALGAASEGVRWVSPAVEAAGAQVREVRSLLSRQEREVLRLYGADLPVKSVARRMGITVGTAKEYLKRLRAKLAVRGVAVSTKVDLRVLAEQLGLLSPQAPCGSTPAVVDVREQAG